MTDAPPIMMAWDGEALRPAAPGWAKLADRHFVIGERYEIVEHKDRSNASHRHYFASVNEAWSNLPAPYDAQFPSADHLRRYALIKAGFCDTQTHVCSSKAEAARMAAFMRPVDEYSIVTATGPVVTRYVAHSQSMRAMGKETFQRSKEMVLDILAGMLGTSTKELTEAA